MKKIIFFLIALFMISVACQRSQFSTTTRHSRNGKVFYVNHYPAERIRSSKVTVHKSHVQGIDAQKKSLVPVATDVQDSKEPNITAINSAPVHRDENLIASNSNGPILISLDENRFADQSNRTKSTASQKGTAGDSITKQVIKYKNGHKEVVRIFSQSHDTLRYELISEKGVVRLVMMEQVDSILQVKSSVNEEEENAVDNRKTEKLGITGLIFSILGWIPVVGIPFAIVSIILLLVSLGKLRRNPGKFRGKSTTIAGLIIWVVGLIGYIALILMGAFGI